ncbi:MAG: hypothetical protein IKU73_06400 [Clostridia bacterium]|nr:hypothetical protein [Clostridia bacterium]
MLKNETAESAVLRRRISAAWRTRTCSASLCVGAQVFLLGSGVAMPLCLSSAWIAALAALPACAAAVWACRRALLHAGGAEPLPYRACIYRKTQDAAHPGGAEPLPYRARYVLLALTLTAGAVLALAALVSLAEQSLLTQARTLFSAGAAVIAVLLCALSRSTGVSRLCFALRWALPAAVALLAAVSIPLGTPAGLFPLLGTGAPALALACACMLPAALPVLMLLLPPPELETVSSALSAAYIPDTGFFLRRILPGAVFGCALLFALSFCSTYESIAAQHTWGQRLRILSSGQPREGVAQALLSVCQMLALLLLAANMLCAAEQALLRAQPKLLRMRAGLLLPAALLALCLWALIFFGMDKALLVAPWLTLPGALCLMPCRERGKGA